MYQYLAYIYVCIEFKYWLIYLKYSNIFCYDKLIPNK